MKGRTIAEAAGLCLLLGDPTRLGILLELAAGPRDTTALGAAAGCSTTIISTGLTLLRLRGLVESTRAGQRNEHALTPAGRELAGVIVRLAVDRPRRR
jgi:ArsR family transcriptional regulator